MGTNATDKPVPREITALLSDERLILRETQRAVTPFWRDGGFYFVFGKDRIRGGDSAAYADPVAFAESHRSQFYLHRVSGIGAGGGQTLRSRQCAAGRSRAACAAGHAPFSHRRYHPQSVSPVRHGPGATLV